MSNPNRPRHARCDYCGRNAHKLAIRLNGKVLGVCPQCWHGEPGRGRGVASRVPGAEIVYDHRTAKKPIFLGVCDGERQWLPADHTPEA